MKLCEALERDHPDRIRIGTETGGGFIYIGKASVLTGTRNEALPRLNRETLEQSRRLEGTNKHVPWRNVLDREVVSVYNSTCEDCRIYIVTGCEKLVDWCGDTDLDAIQEDRAQALVETVYQDVLKELKAAYRRLWKAEGITDRIFFADQVRTHERWIRSDPYGILGRTADGLINQMRKLTEMEIREEERVRRENSADCAWR